MYGIAATLLGQVSVVPAYQEGLYTPEQHIHYLVMETFIYEYRKYIGMLNTYADPYYPPTDRNHHTTEKFTDGKIEVEQHISQSKSLKLKNTQESIEHKSEVTKTTDIPKDKIKDNTNNIITNTISLKEENKQIEEDWVIVKASGKTKTVREAVQKAYIQHLKNRYQVLSDLTDDERYRDVKVVKESIQKTIASAEKEYADGIDCKEQSKPKIEKKYNNGINDINTISMKDMEQIMKEEINKEEEFDEASDDSSIFLTEDQGIHIDGEESVDSEEESNSTEDSHGLTKIEREVFDLISTESDEEDMSDCTTDEGSNVDSKVSATSDNDNNTSKMDVDIESILYQNELLLVRLEQAELNEDTIRKENEKLQALVRNEERIINENNKLLREKEANDLKNKQKISSLEKALKNKTDLLIAALKEKGEYQKTRC